MRTTLTIDDRAYRLAQAVAAQRKESVGKVLGDVFVEHFSRVDPLSSGLELDADGFPIMRLGRPISSADVSEMIDEP